MRDWWRRAKRTWQASSFRPRDVLVLPAAMLLIIVWSGIFRMLRILNVLGLYQLGGIVIVRKRVWIPVMAGVIIAIISIVVIER